VSACGGGDEPSIVVGSVDCDAGVVGLVREGSGFWRDVGTGAGKVSILPEARDFSDPERELWSA
jgi:hypothetical protein